jgi:hypothetical protein
MSTQLAINETELAAKAKAWGTFGEAVYRTELSIQFKASEQIKELCLPSTIADIQDAESLLKKMKAVKLEVQNERKVITGKTDALSARLMEPEKSLDEPIKALEAAIIKVKKEHEAVEKAKRDKDEERKRIVEEIKNYVARCDANYKTIINNLVDVKYRAALNASLSPDTIESYIEETCAAVTIANFPKSQPRISVSLHNEEELNELLKEHVTLSRAEYVQLFAVELEKKLSDYEVAHNNKEEAIRQAAIEKKAKDDEIQQEQNQASIAAKLESVSTVITDTPTLFTKALKKSYEVDMPETIESVLAIQAAFAANINLCLPKLRVAKWFEFKPSQAAAALAKVKCEDNNFRPSGITFKEVDKL